MAAADAALRMAVLRRRDLPPAPRGLAGHSPRAMGWAALYGMRARKRWGPALEKLEKEKAEKVRSEENKQTVQATTR